MRAISTPMSRRDRFSPPHLTYEPNAANMKVMEPPLDWGGKITIVVGAAW